MSIADKLREARALIEDPKRWTTKTYARSDKNRRVGPNSAKAVRWCAVGAVRRVAPRSLWGPAIRALLMNGMSEECHPAQINDTKGHAAVLSMFDEAIRLAEAAE